MVRLREGGIEEDARAGGDGGGFERGGSAATAALRDAGNGAHTGGHLVLCGR